LLTVVSALLTVVSTAERELRRFKAFFGMKPARASEVWSLLIGHNLMPPKAQPMHLLWALLFLKLYGTEDVNAGMIGHDESTIRKWVWLLVKAMHDLSKILVSIRDEVNKARVSNDGRNIR
jgi:hypothetical protein